MESKKFLILMRTGCRLLAFFGVASSFLLSCLFLSSVGFLFRVFTRSDESAWLPRLKAQIGAKASKLTGRICGLEITHQEVPVRPGQAVLCVSNHVSYLDIVSIGSTIPCVFLAKSEVETWPLLGRVSSAMGCLFVRRESLQSRVVVLRKLKRCLEDDSLSVCVFPEGSTTKELFPSQELWQRGQIWAAKQAGVPLVRVGISYEPQDEAAWYDEMSFVPHFLKVLARDVTKVHLSYDVLVTERVCAQPVDTISQNSFETVTQLCQNSLRQIRAHAQNKDRDFDDSQIGEVRDAVKSSAV